MGKYCLVARNILTNDVSFIEINEKWYSPECNGDNFALENSLEAIDLVTSQFKSMEQLVRRLLKNGYIDSDNVDIFIASKRKRGSGSFIRFYNVIYGSKQSLRMSSFRKFARASLEGNIFYAVDDINNVYREFVDMASNNHDFAGMIEEGATDVSPKFMELLFQYPLSDHIPRELRYDREVGMGNYNTLRNMVVVLNNFEGGNHHISYFDEDDSLRGETFERSSTSSRLLRRLDKNYCEGQLSLFSDEVGEGFTYVKE